MVSKFQTPSEVYDAVTKALKRVLLSRNKNEISAGFKTLLCIVKTDCLNDLNPKWTDKSAYPAFEWSRCLVSTRTMQLIKESHFNSPRWSYVKTMYGELFNALYVDILPDTDVIHSAGSVEDLPCKYHISRDLKEDVMKTLESDEQKRVKAKFAKLCKETKNELYCNNH